MSKVPGKGFLDSVFHILEVLTLSLNYKSGRCRRYCLEGFTPPVFTIHSMTKIKLSEYLLNDCPLNNHYGINDAETAFEFTNASNLSFNALKFLIATACLLTFNA